MAKGNKEQRRQSNAQKNALKRRRRSNSIKPKAKTKGKSQMLNWPAEEYLFWVAHGVNYLLSDYAEGVWSPMFSTIYEEGAVPPQLAEVQKAIMTKYGPDNGQWPPEGRAALAWTVQTPQAVFTFYADAKRRCEGVEPEGDLEVLCRKQHHSPVWETFQFLKEQLSARSL